MLEYVCTCNRERRGGGAHKLPNPARPGESPMIISSYRRKCDVRRYYFIWWRQIKQYNDRWVCPPPPFGYHIRVRVYGFTSQLVTVERQGSRSQCDVLTSTSCRPQLGTWRRSDRAVIRSVFILYRKVCGSELVAVPILSASHYQQVDRICIWRDTYFPFNSPRHCH